MEETQKMRLAGILMKHRGMQMEGDTQYGAVAYKPSSCDAWFKMAVESRKQPVESTLAMSIERSEVNRDVTNRRLTWKTMKTNDKERQNHVNEMYEELKEDITAREQVQIVSRAETINYSELSKTEFRRNYQGVVVKAEWSTEGAHGKKKVLAVVFMPESKAQFVHLVKSYFIHHGNSEKVTKWKGQ